MTALRSLSSYAQALGALMPRGRVWPEGGGAVWTQLMAALAVEFRRIDARALRLIEEADPRTCGETLEDWERVLGLPDPCSPGDQTLTERRDAVVALLRAEGGASITYFVGLAADLGQTITIEEHRPFMCGMSPCGHQNVRRETGPPTIRFVWTVTLTTPRLRRYHIGHGGAQAGVDSLLTITRASEIECLFNRLKPAHTTVVFNYDDGV